AAEGGGILADQNSLPTITNCILWNNGDDLDGCSATYSCIQDGDPGTGNTNSDPLFLTGPLGDYYLTQIAAGQLTDSPCVNAGDPNIPFTLLLGYTTRTDSVIDLGLVDIGAHYLSAGVELLQLNTSVIGGNGTVDPNSNLFRKYSVVRLEATPDPNYRVKEWTGTDDDSSTDVHNTVTMITDVNVTVAAATELFRPITEEANTLPKVLS
ncbi:MAG: InlB B-repeat-containing protein, partial [Planctomycetota bacterium]